MTTVSDKTLLAVLVSLIAPHERDLLFWLRCVPTGIGTAWATAPNAMFLLTMASSVGIADDQLRRAQAAAERARELAKLAEPGDVPTPELNAAQAVREVISTHVFVAAVERHRSAAERESTVVVEMPERRRFGSMAEAKRVMNGRGTVH